MATPMNLELGLSGSQSYAQKITPTTGGGDVVIYETGSSGQASQGLSAWVVVALVAAAVVVVFLFFRRR